MNLLRAAALLALVSACGPSFQAVYEGNARFEHCYALEENQEAPMPSKGECWRDWSEHYTYGQTRDRIQYAIARYVALTSAAMPTDEAMMAAAPGVVARQTSINAPAPTNAFAPPPKVLDEDAGAGPPLRPSEKNRTIGDLDAGSTKENVTTPLPGADCETKCSGEYRTCQRGADGGLAPKCEKAFKGCMRTCFK